MISWVFTWAFCNLTSCFPAGVKVHTLSVLTDTTTQAFRLWLNHPLQNEVKWQVCWEGVEMWGCVMGRVVRGLGHYVICAIKVWRVTLWTSFVQECVVMYKRYLSDNIGSGSDPQLSVHGSTSLSTVWQGCTTFLSWSCNLPINLKLVDWSRFQTNSSTLISVPDYLLTSIQYMCMYR